MALQKCTYNENVTVENIQKEINDTACVINFFIQYRTKYFMAISLVEGRSFVPHHLTANARDKEEIDLCSLLYM